MNRGVQLEGWGWRHAIRRDWAVRHLTFHIDPGERVLLLGPSGAGKSTLLSALAGVLGGADEGEEEGSLTVDGQHPSTLKGHAALMMHDPESQIVLARLGDDVGFGCENMCVPPSEIWPRVRASVEVVGLNLPLDHPTDHLSGGEQQRLVLAGALAMGANLLILDEPTANLDSAGLLQVRDAVADAVADRTRSLIVVEHHSEVWAPLVDRVMVLTPGGLVADGPPDDIFTQMGTELAEMGVWVPAHYVPGLKHGDGPSLEHGDSPSLKHDNCPSIGHGNGSSVVGPSLDHGDGSSARDSSLEHGSSVRGPRSDMTPVLGTYNLFQTPSQSSRTPTTPVLSTHNLTIGYGSTPVRTDLNLSIPAGRSTVITGPNGSGKTTLALTLAGLLAPLAGRVEAGPALAPPEGTSPHSTNPHSWKSRELLTRIGTVFQSPDHQFVTSSVFDEIAVGLRALKMNREKVHEVVTRLLEDLRLTHLAKANPFTLSGGEKRRLSVATVLACNPQVIVLDEPTFGQDRLTWASMVDIVGTLRDQGTTIISVTHDQSYIEALGDHRIDMGQL